MERNPDVAGASITGIGGGLILLGTFLPWVTAQAGFISVNRNALQLGENNSLSIDGILLLVFGILAIVIAITRASGASMPRFLQGSAIVVGVIAGLLCVYDIIQVNDLTKTIRDASSLATASVGF